VKVVRTAVTMVLGILLPLLVQLWDRRRMGAERRQLAWGYASWGSALYAFGPLSMLGWIFGTRPRWLRCLVAPLWTVPTLGAVLLGDQLLAWWLLDDSLEIDVLELVTTTLGLFAALVGLMLVIELIVIAWRRVTARRGISQPPAVRTPPGGGPKSLV